jgi:hypothetical protein
VAILGLRRKEYMVSLVKILETVHLEDYEGKR